MSLEDYVCREMLVLLLSQVQENKLFSALPANLGALTIYLLVSSADGLANSLVPDLARQNVGPALDQNCLTLIRFQKE